MNSKSIFLVTFPSLSHPCDLFSRLNLPSILIASQLTWTLGCVPALFISVHLCLSSDTVPSPGEELWGKLRASKL